MRQLLSLILPFHGLLFCTALTSTLFAAGSREVQVAPAPSWVEPMPITPASPAPAAVGRHYWLIETQTHVATHASYRHNAYRILDENGLRHGSQINLPFDPEYETLTIHHLRLIRDGQSLDRLDRAKIQVLQRETDLEYLLYHGELSALIILDDVRIGDVVEVAFTKTGVNPVFGDHYIDGLTLDWGMPVGHLRHRVIYPSERALWHRTFGGPAMTVRESDTATDRELLWEARDLPAVVYDRNIPAWHETNAQVQLTDFSSWHEVVNWALPLYAESNSSATALREQIAALRTGGKTPAERALLALRFVQEEVRYLGIEQGPGSHRPSSPEDVFARRFGDCKDKARLLVSLLRQMDLDAMPVLVHSSRRHTLKEWLPSPFAFNHVIVLLRLDGEEYLLDPTLTYQRGNLRQRHTTRYHTGLVIEPGNAVLTTWTETPNDLAQINVEEHFTITGLESSAQLRVQSTYSARAAERMRGYLATTNRDDLAKSYVDFYARYYPEISSDGPVTWHDDDRANTLVVEERYSIPRIFVETANEHILKATFYPTALNNQTNSPGAARRTAPLAVAHPEDITNLTRISLHEPWPIKNAETHIKDTAFHFDRTVVGREKSIELTYRWRSQADHVKPEEFSAHSRNIARVNEVVGYELTYNTAATSAEDGRYRVNWAMVALAVTTLLLAGFGAFRIWRVRANHPLPPPLPSTTAYHHAENLTGLGGWLILVGLGVVARPITAIVNVGTSAKTYFNLTTWEILTARDGEAYQPAYAFAAPMEMVLNLILFVGSVLMVALFFGRRRTLPPALIGLFALELLVCVFDTWVSHALTTISAEERRQSYVGLARGMSAASIWIPYLLVSRRVKQTFTR